MSNRNVLKSYFVTNAVPKQSDFADLIDSAFIQPEDGIRKTGQQPLSVQAQAADNGEQQVLHFYKNFGDSDAAWKLSLQGATPGSNSSGLRIGNAAAPNALFIDEESGNVGIGVINPVNKLEVNGAVHTDGNPIYFRKDTGDKYDFIRWDKDADELILAGFKGVSLGYTEGLVGDQMTRTLTVKNGNVGVGTGNPLAKLDVWGDLMVGGAIRPSNGNTSANGIYFSGDPAGGSGDTAWIRYRAQNYSSNTPVQNDKTVLEIGTSNDTDDHIALMPSGNVGIGTSNPQAKLHVEGAIHAGTSEIYFTKTDHYHTGFGNQAGYAAIENSSNYTALMILGRSKYANDKLESREIKLYDNVYVSGKLYIKDAQVNPSDVRIKHNIHVSDSGTNLHMINQLQVKEYFVRKNNVTDNHLHKGFIAQEVEAILPEAVSRHSDFIPDIFSPAASAVLDNGTLSVTMPENHHLSTGDTVSLVTSAGNIEVPVSVLNENSFSVENWRGPVSDLFVYGKKVDDFRTLNYDTIFTVGISAIQELYKQLQAVKEEVASLREKMVTGYLAAV